MQFTAFSEFGQFEFSGAPCLAQRVYNALWADLGEQYARDGYTDAKVYATAMALARMLTTQARLDAQIHPSTALELLHDREVEYGIVVPATATIASRRAELAARMKAALGCSLPNLQAALTDLLGDDFVETRTHTASDAVKYPATAGGIGNFVHPRTPRRLFQLRDNLSLLGLKSAAILNVDGTVPTDADMPSLGETITVEPEHNTLRESVTVLAAGTAGSACYLQATFTKAHHAGARIVCGPWPLWASTKRHTVVRVSEAAATDGPTHRAIDGLLARVFRAVSTWSVAGDDGPFELDASYLDITLLSAP